MTLTRRVRATLSGIVGAVRAINRQLRPARVGLVARRWSSGISGAKRNRTPIRSGVALCRCAKHATLSANGRRRSRHRDRAVTLLADAPYLQACAEVKRASAPLSVREGTRRRRHDTGCRTCQGLQTRNSAAQRETTLQAAIVMVIFGLGAAAPLVALAYGSRQVVLSRRDRLRRASAVAKPIMGISIAAMGLFLCAHRSRQDRRKLPDQRHAGLAAEGIEFGGDERRGNTSTHAAAGSVRRI